MTPAGDFEKAVVAGKVRHSRYLYNLRTVILCSILIPFKIICYSPFIVEVVISRSSRRCFKTRERDAEFTG